MLISEASPAASRRVTRSTAARAVGSTPRRAITARAASSVGSVVGQSRRVQQRGGVGLDLEAAAVSAPAGSFPGGTGVCPISSA